MTTPLPARGDINWDVALNAAVAEIKVTADAAETPTGSQAKATAAQVAATSAAATDATTKANAVNATLTAHTGNVSNPHAVTKAQVGLGNVDNTADVSKPVSTATQTTINARSGLPGYAPTASPNTWDMIRGIYNLKSSNTRLLSQGIGNAMLAGRTLGGMTEHLVIGDSVSAGAVSSIGITLYDRLDAWPLAMRDQLANGGVPANGCDIRAVDGPSASDARMAFTGTWVNSTSYTAATVVSSTATASPDRSGSMVDVNYYDGFNSVATVAVDGTTVGTITANGAAGWKVARFPATVIGGFSKIVLTVTTIGSGFALSAFTVWSPNSGLIVRNPSQSGATASGTGAAAWVDIASANSLGNVYNNWAGRRRTTSTASSTSGSSTLTATGGAFTSNDLGKPIDELNVGAGGRMFPPSCYVGAILSSTTVRMDTGIGSAAAPALAISTQSAQQISIGRDPSCIHIALGLNDMAALAASDATITAAITTIRNRYPNSDCILHLTHEFAPSYVSSARQATFQTAMYALADTLDVPLYDWRDRVGTYAQGAAYGVYGDSAVHLSPATESGLGSDIASIVGAGNGRAQTSGSPVFDNDLVNKAYIDRRKVKSSAAAALTTVESVVLKLPIPANGFALDDTLRYGGWLVPAATTVTTVKVHIGPLGTSADPAVVTMSATAATNTAPRYIEGTVGITAIGASATFVGGGTETVGAIAAAGAATAATSSFNSTVNNYVTVTVQNGTSTTTTLRGGVLEWV